MGPFGVVERLELLPRSRPHILCYGFELVACEHVVDSHQRLAHRPIVAEQIRMDRDPGSEVLDEGVR